MLWEKLNDLTTNKQQQNKKKTRYFIVGVKDDEKLKEIIEIQFKIRCKIVDQVSRLVTVRRSEHLNRASTSFTYFKARAIKKI